MVLLKKKSDFTNTKLAVTAQHQIAKFYTLATGKPFKKWAGRTNLNTHMYGLRNGNIMSDGTPDANGAKASKDIIKAQQRFRSWTQYREIKYSTKEKGFYYA